MEKYYTNGEITIKWQPEVCQHSTICWKGLLPVFDPRRSPWIDMDASTTERIIEQINKCPSKALTYFYNDPEKNK
jgi:uncharacterized Fe-S cluster protein YjdI